MREVYIGDQIVIDNADEMLRVLEKESGYSYIDINDVVDFINKEKATKFYFDSAMNGKSETLTLGRDIKYLWCDTGFTDSNGHALFISMIARDGYFSGHFVGISVYLAGKIADYFPENRKEIFDNEMKFRDKYEKKIETRTTKHQNEQYRSKRVITPKPSSFPNPNKNNEKELKEYWESEPAEVTKEIHEMLLVNNWKTIKGLDRYIKTAGTRAYQLIGENKTDYCLINKLGSVVLNTGLMDKFGTPIYVMYKKHLGFKTCTPYKVIESKTEYIKEGFISKASDNTELLPISFFDEDDRFDATIEQFDITPKSLSHIIEERKARFPEETKTMSDMMMASKIRQALEIGIKLQQTDSSYAKPIYSTTTGAITWTLPLHINRNITDEPELVLAVRKTSYFYEIKTILPYDDELKDRLTALSLYGRLW